MRTVSYTAEWSAYLVFLAQIATVAAAGALLMVMGKRSARWYTQRCVSSGSRPRRQAGTHKSPGLR